MKIGIISDVHDNAHNLTLILEEIYKNEDIEKIIFLGDFAGAAIAAMLSSSILPVFSIWGNNDGDKYTITKFSLADNSNLEMSFTNYDIIEIDGRKIFLSHFPMLAKSMAKSGDFDVVFYGHNHLKHKEKINDCLIINPGEVGAYKTGISSYAIYDTKTNDGNIFILENSITANTEISQKKFKEMKFEFNKHKGHQYN